jgi:hypothetical protein
MHRGDTGHDLRLTVHRIGGGGTPSKASVLPPHRTCRPPHGASLRGFQVTSRGTRTAPGRCRRKCGHNIPEVSSVRREAESGRSWPQIRELIAFPMTTRGGSNRRPPRFPCKEYPNIPSSSTARSRRFSRGNANRRVAFRPSARRRHFGFAAFRGCVTRCVHLAPRHLANADAWFGPDVVRYFLHRHRLSSCTPCRNPGAC